MIMQNHIIDNNIIALAEESHTLIGSTLAGWLAPEMYTDWERSHCRGNGEALNDKDRRALQMWLVVAKKSTELSVWGCEGRQSNRQKCN